jgi:hypothetical protein
MKEIMGTIMENIMTISNIKKIVVIIANRDVALRDWQPRGPD